MGLYDYMLWFGVFYVSCRPYFVSHLAKINSFVLIFNHFVLDLDRPNSDSFLEMYLMNIITIFVSYKFMAVTFFRI
jgi:hypothetical protein